MNDIVSDQIFRLSAQAAIEDFDDGSLVLLCNDLRLVELNHTARQIVGLIDGARTLEQIAEIIARTYSEPFDQALTDVTELLNDLQAQGVVELSFKIEPRRFISASALRAEIERREQFPLPRRRDAKDSGQVDEQTGRRAF